MLHVAIQPNAIFSRPDTVNTSVFASPSGMTSTVLAGDLAFNDASASTSLSSGGQSSLQNSGSRSKSRNSTQGSTSKESLIGNGDDQSPKNGAQEKATPNLRRSGTLSLIDNTILPIKSQITLRKAGLVIRMLILLRLCTLCLQPASRLSPAFPYLPLESASSRASNSSTPIMEIPFIHHFTQSPINSLSTWVRHFSNPASLTF